MGRKHGPPLTPAFNDTVTSHEQRNTTHANTTAVIIYRIRIRMCTRVYYVWKMFSSSHSIIIRNSVFFNGGKKKGYGIKKANMNCLRDLWRIDF